MIKYIHHALELYKIDTGDYPPTYLNLMSGDETLYYYLTKEPSLNFRQRYNKICDKDRDGIKEIADSWGNPIQYKILKELGALFVYSFGPNGKDEGGKGDDITIEEIR